MKFQPAPFQPAPSARPAQTRLAKLMGNLSPRPIASLVAIAGLALLNCPSPVWAAAVGPDAGLPISAATLEDGSSEPTVTSGAYLFGESAQPGEIGHEYMVFEVKAGRMVGAFFLPQSDFSCFSGNIQGDVMSLTVEGDSLQDSSTISVQLYLSNQVAASPELLLPFESALGLQGTYRIPELDQTSRTVLETCKADLSF
ncbi:MAG: hypothetical protein HC824_05400 [Synechococcales cyanobacterium RM1_1_8]|nr:hypothetical protein [Synechococcales cyanobacterium RM1_1_8]